MNVSVTGQDPGRTAVLVRVASDASSHGTRPADARTDDGHVGATQVARQAWFDLNGDGRIEDLSSLYGGDGTFIVPKSVAKNGRAQSRQVPDPESFGSREGRVTPVTVEHARGSYARYSTTATTHASEPAAEVA
ncbi:MAG: hypothetical protein ACT4OX_09650 [Actinomycetota bacterium]